MVENLSLELLVLLELFPNPAFVLRGLSIPVYKILESVLDRDDLIVPDPLIRVVHDKGFRDGAMETDEVQAGMVFYYGSQRLIPPLIEHPGPQAVVGLTRYDADRFGDVMQKSSCFQESEIEPDAVRVQTVPQV